MKPLSIQRYVSWLTLAPVLILALCMESYFLLDRFALMDTNLIERSELISDQLASSSDYGVFSHNLDFLQNIAGAALHESDVQGVLIMDSGAQILSRAGQFSTAFTEEIISDNHRRTQIVAKLSGDNKLLLLNPEKFKDKNFWIFRPIIPEQIKLDDTDIKETLKPTGYVILEISKSRNKSLKIRMLWITLLVTFLFLALTLYVVKKASSRITLPISDLSLAVQAIGAGKLDTRVSVSSEVQELATLAQGLNNSAGQLQQEQSILQQRIEEATLALREKKDEAERANSNKSRFLAAAGHDLRQPLHAIGLFVYELQRKLTGGEQERLVGKVAESVEAFSELLNALLDISKLDAGVITPDIRSFNMDIMLKRIEEEYKRLAATKNIALYVRSCNLNVISDPILLERIIINLLCNAIRYTDRYGTILVACRCRGEFLRIEVSDNGCGISEMDQANIFREFYQINRPGLDAGKGLGLGLAIVDRLTKLLGHKIDLRSAPGKGSRFAIEVPLGALSSKSYPAAVPQITLDNLPDTIKSPLTGLRLLCVDDDEAVLSGTVNLLSSWGCKVSQASSLEEVNDYLHNGEEWDFIVSDYQLQNNTNGIQVISRVQQHQKQAIPCILITGDTSQEVLQLASTHGYTLMYKPLKPAKLRSLITHLLSESA